MKNFKNLTSEEISSLLENVEISEIATSLRLKVKHSKQMNPNRIYSFDEINDFVTIEINQWLSLKRKIKKSEPEFEEQIRKTAIALIFDKYMHWVYL